MDINKNVVMQLHPVVQLMDVVLMIELFVEDSAVLMECIAKIVEIGLLVAIL